MGMFDYVNFETTCPNCGKVVTGFQSKDGPRNLLTLETDQVRNWYTTCQCGHGLYFERRPEEKMGHLVDYPRAINKPFVVEGFDKIDHVWRYITDLPTLEEARTEFWTLKNDDVIGKRPVRIIQILQEYIPKL